MSLAQEPPDGMWDTPEWYRDGIDDRILELVAEEGNMTPKAASKEGDEPRLRWSATYINDRMSALERHGLLKRIAKGVYAITDDGKAWLDRELDLRDL
jgi:DNA-binding PadR family transcriptional regulator